VRTNIEIDDVLMSEALRASGLPTKKAVVEEALRQLVRRRAVDGIRSLRGTIDFWDDYDYKAMRQAHDRE
jgi:Arc/MetJ family transcription regulator